MVGASESCNGLRKNSDTGVDRRHLHDTSFIDGFARVASGLVIQFVNAKAEQIFWILVSGTNKFLK